MTVNAPAAPADGDKKRDLNKRVQAGIELHQKRELNAAEAIYREVLEQDPIHSSALHFLGLLHFHRDELDDAERLLGRAIAFNPDYADAYNNLGNVLRSRDQLIEAGVCYQRAIDIDSEHQHALRNLAEVSREAGNMELAIAVFQRIVELDPDSFEGRQDLGIILFNTGRYRDAMPHFEAAARLRPGTGVRYNLGMAYHSSGMPEKAHKVFADWFREDPENPVARHMAAAFSDSGSVPDQADEAYVRMIFDQFADDFDRILTQHLEYQVPLHIAQAVKSRYSSESSRLNILDLGCGTGLCAKALKPYARSLVGLDLSRRMLEQAKKLDLYDDLVLAELTDFFAQNEQEYDLIVAGDTLCYLGDLESALAGARRSMSSHGRFIFSLELGEAPLKNDYHLQMNGRYKHSRTYIERVLTESDLKLESLELVTLRLEGGDPVAGMIVVAGPTRQI